MSIVNGGCKPTNMSLGGTTVHWYPRVIKCSIGQFRMNFNSPSSEKPSCSSGISQPATHFHHFCCCYPIFVITNPHFLQLWPFTSYKYWSSPIYEMYNPIEITSCNHHQSLLATTMCGPPVTRWFKNPMNTIVISITNPSYWSYLLHLRYRSGAPHCSKWIIMMIIKINIGIIVGYKPFTNH